MIFQHLDLQVYAKSPIRKINKIIKKIKNKIEIKFKSKSFYKTS